MGTVLKTLLLLLLTPAMAWADPIRIAVIDTGFTPSNWYNANLCDNPGETGKDKQGRDKASNGIDDDGNGFVDDVHGWNFVDNNNNLSDDHGHGTHIAGLIHQSFVNYVVIEKALREGVDLQELVHSVPTTQDYCLYIFKYYDAKGNDFNNLINTVKSIKQARKLNVDLINYSGGGIAPSEEEKEQVEAAINQGIVFVAAAGNERSDLDVRRYYPAAYPGVVSVAGWQRTRKSSANLDMHNRLPEDLKRVRWPSGAWLEAVPTSNWGTSVSAWELGNDLLSTLPNGAGYMSGTSQATAIHTGKLARRLLDIRHETALSTRNVCSKGTKENERTLFDPKQNQGTEPPDQHRSRPRLSDHAHPAG